MHLCRLSISSTDHFVSPMACVQKHDFKVEEDAETREDAQALMECVLHGIDIGAPDLFVGGRMSVGEACCN